MSRLSKQSLGSLGTKGAVTVIYKKAFGSTWAHVYPTKAIAQKSARTLLKGGHKLVGARVAKGFNYGAVVARANGTAYVPVKKRKSRKK